CLFIRGMLLAVVLLGAAPAFAAEARVDVAAALEPLLRAEFALQAGRLEEAGRDYLEAARITGEADLARRATAVALLARDDEVAAQALELWRAHDGGGLDLAAAEATVAIR